MMDFFKQLAKEKELRDLIKLYIDMVEVLENTSKELSEVRELANKLYENESQLRKFNYNLQQDKKALTKFIEDNISDEEQLKKIFN
jgi:hypothetical protein